MQATVSLHNVSREFKKDDVRAVNNVSLNVPSGEFLAIFGPSGSGKSTLLNLIGGIEFPDSGKVFVGGKEPRGSMQWANLRAEKIGFIFQSFHLLPTLTAVENVEIPMFGVIAGSAARQKKAKDLMAKVGLGERCNHKPGELSGGERQRVAIARSLANSPAILLADEPTGNLDTRTSAEIIALFDKIHQEEGKTIIMVTHEAGIAAHATRLISFMDGCIYSDEKGGKCIL